MGRTAIWSVGREREPPKKQERNSQKGRRKTRRERCLPFPKRKKTELEPAEAKKEGEECRNPLNLAVALPDRKTMRYNVSGIHFGKYLKD